MLTFSVLDGCPSKEIAIYKYLQISTEFRCSNQAFCFWWLRVKGRSPVWTFSIFCFSFNPLHAQLSSLTSHTSIVSNCAYTCTYRKSYCKAYLHARFVVYAPVTLAYGNVMLDFRSFGNGEILSWPFYACLPHHIARVRSVYEKSYHVDSLWQTDSKLQSKNKTYRVLNCDKLKIASFVCLTIFIKL